MISLRAIANSLPSYRQPPQHLVRVPIVPGVDDSIGPESSHGTARNLQRPCGERGATVVVTRRPRGLPTHEYVMPCGKGAFYRELKVRKDLEERLHGVAGGLTATERRWMAGRLANVARGPPRGVAGGLIALSPPQRPPPHHDLGPAVPPPR